MQSLKECLMIIVLGERVLVLSQQWVLFMPGMLRLWSVR